MDLRHYNSNGLELSSILLFEVGLINIVIRNVNCSGNTNQLQMHCFLLISVLFYENSMIYCNIMCKKRYFQALIFTFHLQRHINWVIFVPTMEKFEKVRPQSRAYMVIEYSLHIFTPPPLIVIVKRVCQQGKKVAFMHICISTYNKKIQ